MSDADLLLDAIWASPGDDTPRLAYADWLEENGHLDYAQFIRLSILADRGCRSLAERQKIRWERIPLWERIVASSVLPIEVDWFERGFCKRVALRTTEFMEGGMRWWPTVTPARLELYSAHGWESEIASAANKHLPWLRELRCDNRLTYSDHDLEQYPPLRGDLVATFARPGLLPRLESLEILIAEADLSSMSLLADSELVLRLREFFLAVRLPGTTHIRAIHIKEKLRPDAIRLAIHSFIDRHRAV
jgi:uncharacterized protein (TIGR02996 family)